MSSPPSKYPTAGPSAPMTYMMAEETEGEGHQVDNVTQELKVLGPYHHTKYVIARSRARLLRCSR